MDEPAAHEHAARIRRHVRGQGGRAQIHGRDALLPRLLLLREDQTLRRRALVRRAAGFGRRGALQAPRLARAGALQDARGHRLRHHQRRTDRIGRRSLPRQQVGGAGAQGAVLSLRGHLPQVPRPAARRPRRRLLPRSGRQSRRRDHPQGPLQTLPDGQSAEGLHDALRAGEGQHRRVSAGHRLRLRHRRPSQRLGLHAAAHAGTPGPDAQVHQHLPHERRHGLHRQTRLAGDAVHRGDGRPRPAAGTEHPHAGLHAHRPAGRAAARFRRHGHRLPAREVRAGSHLLQRQQRPHRLGRPATCPSTVWARCCSSTPRRWPNWAR